MYGACKANAYCIMEKLQTWKLAIDLQAQYLAN